MLQVGAAEINGFFVVNNENFQFLGVVFLYSWHQGVK